MFCAIVILYVYVIQKRSTPERDLLHYLQMGEEAQDELAKCGTQASFPQRYVVVLEELRKEAIRLTGQSSVITRNGDGLQESHRGTDKADLDTILPHETALGTGTYNDAFGNELGESNSADWITNFAQDPSPASYLADMTGWGEFDSLVLTGLGELSHIFPDNGSQY